MTNKIYGTRVTVPEFEIFSAPTVRIADIKNRRFSLFDRFLEESVEYSVKVLSSSTERGDRRKYIISYIRDNSRYNNLRTAIKEVCPEYEEMLDKLLILK